MKTIHLLLGSNNRRLNTQAEIAVRDVCYEHAVVECLRVQRLDEIIQRGSCEDYDLIVLAPDHLQAGPLRRNQGTPVEEAIRAIGTIKSHRAVPILAMGVPADQELTVLMAGAENVFPVIFNDEVFKTEVRRVLGISERVEQAEPTTVERKPSFVESFRRGLDRFKQVVGN